MKNTKWPWVRAEGVQQTRQRRSAGRILSPEIKTGKEVAENSATFSSMDVRDYLRGGTGRCGARRESSHWPREESTNWSTWAMKKRRGTGNRLRRGCKIGR